MTNTCTNGPQTHLLPATARASGIGILRVGFLESRAVARLLMAAREAVGGEGILFRVGMIANPAPSGTRCNCKAPPQGSVAICRCFVPSEVTKGLL
jgi:hypothetical protein